MTTVVLLLALLAGEPPEKPAAPPDLDELLGTSGAKPKDTPKPGEAAGANNAGSAKPEAGAPNELDRALSPDETRDVFTQAVEGMKESAARLTGSKDAGLATQRVQEEVLRKLDKLIEEAKKKQSQSKSSQSKGKQQKPQDQQSEQDQQNAKKNQAETTSKQQSRDSKDRTESTAREDGALRPAPLAGGATWGNLPAHVRDSLTQGLSDQFSSAYRRLTEQYYKRLAEEPKP